MTTDQKRELCETITRKLLAKLGDDMDWLRLETEPRGPRGTS
jgi:hypothetical protein